MPAASAADGVLMDDGAKLASCFGAWTESGTTAASVVDGDVDASGVPTLAADALLFPPVPGDASAFATAVDVPPVLEFGDESISVRSPHAGHASSARMK
jgi:hypothetical protein